MKRNKRKRKPALLAALAAAAIAIFPGSASAAEWFVSPDGSDAASGLSSAPFRTINHAISRASANDTITLLPGDHVEGSITAEGLASRVVVDKPLTIRSKGRAYRDRTRIVGAYDPDSPAGIGPNAVRCLWIDEGGSGTRLEGITFYHGSTDVDTNNIPRTRGGGVYVQPDINAIVVDCAFIECQAGRGGGFCAGSVRGAYGGSVNDDAQVHRSLFKRCRAAKFGPGMRGGSAYNCVFDDCIPTRDDSTGEYFLVEGMNNPSRAFVYGYRAVNCTFANNSGAGIRIDGDGLFAGGIYNCLFQNNGETNGVAWSSALVKTLPEILDNVSGDALTVRPEVFSPYDDDYRLTAGAKSIGAGNVAHLLLIPEEFRGADYYGRTRTTDGAVHAGAAQEVLPVASSGVQFLWRVDGDWHVGGRKAEVCNRTWKAAKGWPAPILMKFVPSDGSALMRYSQGGGIVWPLRDDSVWMTTSKRGVVQSLSAMVTKTITWADPVNGSDETGDGSEANPYGTLNKAVQAAASNHVVYAKAGDYCRAEETASGSLKNRVVVPETFEGQLRVVAVDGPDVTFITGREGTEDPDHKLGGDAVRCIAVAGTNKNYNAAYQGFTLRDGHTSSTTNAADQIDVCGGALANITYGSGPGNIETAFLLDCVVTNCTAVRGAATAGGFVMRCRIFDCHSTHNSGGVFRESNVRSSLIDGCGGRTSIFAYSLRGPGYNCTIVNCTQTAVADASTEGNPLHNSVAGNRADNGNALGPNTRGMAKYVLYDTASASTNVGFGCVQENPIKFVDADGGDYRLRADSAGYALAMPEQMKDCMDVNGDPFVFDADGRYQVGCFAPRPASQQATIYADAANGSDETGDGSEAAPFATLAAAMAAAKYGDTVVALPGVYDSGTMVPSLAQAGGDVTPTIAARVVVKDGVTLVSRDGAAATTIRGAEATGGGCGDDAVRCVFLCRGATLRGFTVTGGYTAASVVGDSTNATMNVDNCGGGVAGYYAGDSASADEFAELVEDCVIVGNMALRGGGGHYGVYRNCTFSGNASCAGKPGCVLARAKAEGCFFDDGDSPAPGIAEHSAIYRCTLVNCTVRGGQPMIAGVVVNQGGNYKERPVLNTVIMANYINVYAMTNCVLGATVSNKCAGATATANVVVGPAGLDENGVPLPRSAVIDAGDNAFVSAELLAGRDPAGVRRVLNQAIDIGAFEYDWRGPWAGAFDIGLTLDDLPPSAALEGDHLAFTSGTVAMTWENGRRCRVQVTGSGWLFVTLNGEIVGVYTSVDGVKGVRFPPSATPHTLRFTYVPSSEDTGDAGVELYDFSHEDYATLEGLATITAWEQVDGIWHLTFTTPEENLTGDVEDLTPDKSFSVKFARVLTDISQSGEAADGLSYGYLGFAIVESRVEDGNVVVTLTLDDDEKVNGHSSLFVRIVDPKGL